MIAIPGGRRPGEYGTACGPSCFNPRLPGGRRQRHSLFRRAKDVFQSTPSGGKATHLSLGSADHHDVSIHAFRGEGDSSNRIVVTSDSQFQSTPSGGKATRAVGRFVALIAVSIHAFRGEGDPRLADFAAAAGSFNPRLPGGRRRTASLWAAQDTTVSIHAFRGEGDPGRFGLWYYYSVSIHAFRGEGDSH